jgi:plastocyanin
MRQILYNLATFVAAVYLLDASNYGSGELATKCLPARVTTTVDSAEPRPTTVAARQIAIENFTFRPPVLTVPVGTKVTWINSDDVPHTATSTQKVFASPTLGTDDRFEFVFDKPGTFEYFCTVHRHMVGKVIVTKPVTLSESTTVSAAAAHRLAPTRRSQRAVFESSTGGGGGLNIAPYGRISGPGTE